MEAFLTLVGSAGIPTSFVGVLLLLYFSVRKQEATVRAEQLATIERLRADVVALDAAKDKAEAIIEQLRGEKAEQHLEIVRLRARLIGLGHDEK